MKSSFYAILLFIFVLNVHGQSGRVKAIPVPAPTSSRPRDIYSPPSENTQVAKPVPAPVPKPKAEETNGEIIRVESALVPIPVSVIDSEGRAITNLRLDDFQLEVDGKPAVISDISRSPLPTRLALLFDNSWSLSSARDFEKKAAIRFLQQVIRPNQDQAALFSISTVSRLEQPLTADISQVVRAIDAFPTPEGATALFDGIVQAADYLSIVAGRRVIVIVSDGEDNSSRVETTLEKTIHIVQKANCQVYVVRTTDFENFKRTGDRRANPNVRFLTNERRMQEITGQTGGMVYNPVDESELSAAFTQISGELSDQYVLFHYPENFSRDGHFRSIKLQVKNQKDVTVRARKGYYPF